MKKSLFRILSVLLIVTILISLPIFLSAETTEAGVESVELSDLTLDESALDYALVELNTLDNYLIQNQETTYADLQATGSVLVKNISSEAAPMAPVGDLLKGFLFKTLIGVGVTAAAIGFVYLYMKLRGSF